MRGNILVSVVIPVYNAAPYLRQCLDSVINQTLHEIEVICVDDSSTDESLDILREYERADERVLVIARPHENAGAARNAGLDASRGKYLYFLDADDFIESDAMETAVDRAEATGAEIIMFDAYFLDDQTCSVTGKLLPREYWPSKEVFAAEDEAEHLFQFCLALPWNKLFMRNAIQRASLHFSSIGAANDRFFCYIASVSASSIAVLDKCLIFNRINRPNSLGSVTRYPDASYEADLSTKQALIKLGKWDKFQRSFLNLSLQYMLFYLNRAPLYEVFSYIWRNSRDLWFRDLGITGHPKEYFFESPAHYDWLQLIITSEPSEDIFEEMRVFGFWNPPLPAMARKFWYLDLLTAYPDFCRFWQKTRGELDMTALSREDFDPPAHYDWLKFIAANEPNKDIFYERRMIGFGNPPFPTDRIARGSDIVLYGAGGVGRAYHEWLSCSKYCNVALWLDRQAEKLWPPIVEPSAITGSCYDHVVIAVGDPDAAREIGNDLVKSYAVNPTRLIYVN